MGLSSRRINIHIDNLNNVNRSNTAKVAFRIVDRLQDFPKHEQTAAVAVLFLLITRVLKLSPQQLYSLAKNITKIENDFKDEQDRTFLALEEYVRGELL